MAGVSWGGWVAVVVDDLAAVGVGAVAGVESGGSLGEVEELLTGGVELVDLVVADISFNTQGRIVGPAVGRRKPGGRVMLLVKPQVELERAAVGEGGIVRDPAAWAEACDRVAAVVRGFGLTVDGVVRSSITGTEGNVEFMLAGTR